MMSLIKNIIFISLLSIKFTESFLFNNQVKISYNFYARDLIEGVKKISINNITDTTFRLSRNTVFIVHGFNSNPDTINFLRLKDELLIKEDLNIFLVDWQNEAFGIDYFKAVYNVRLVGKEIAKFLKQPFMSPSKTHCIGHSLGAHVCGYTGKEIKLKRISGLDPAGPLFGQKSSERLDKNDADLVDIIHTDSTLGFNSPIGHMDFYPNGGGSQPNCKDKKDQFDEKTTFDENRARFINFGMMTCSHSRSIELFATTINSNCLLQAIECNSYVEYLTNKCECKSSDCLVPMGYNLTPQYQNKTGRFYLKTTGNIPFCLLNK